MDVSDGLVQDLGHIARLAGCGAEIDEAAVPLSQAATAMIAADSALFDAAVSGGDDYELLLAASPAERRRIAAAAGAAGTDLRRIGRLVAGEGVSLRAKDGRCRRLAREGWTHF